MMKHAKEIRAKFGVLGKLAAALAVGFAMNAAQATNNIIDFEGLPIATFGASDGNADGFVFHGDGFEQYGVTLGAYAYVDQPTSADFVGTVVNGSDVQNTCFNLACPVNNPSTFYGALNDGYVELSAAPGQSLHVYGLDASFIGDYAVASYPTVAGLLRIDGTLADGTTTTITFDLAGPTKGDFNFQHIDTGAAFAAQDFVYVDIFGYVCNTSGDCKAFQTDEGQFALDNIDLGPSAVSAVPEANSWLMLSLGLAGITVAARRRNNATRNRA